MAAVTVLFVLLTVKYDAFCAHFSISVPWNMSLLLKGYEFVLGMYLATELPKLPKAWRWAAAAVTLVFLVCPVRIPGNDALKTTAFALCFFIAASLLEPLLQKRNRQFLSKLSAFTYPLFLVHHAVIYEITPLAKPFLSGTGSIALLFAAELAVMTVLGLFVQTICRFLSGKLAARHD